MHVSFMCATGKRCRGDTCVAPTGAQRYMVQMKNQGNDRLVCHVFYPTRFDITCYLHPSGERKSCFELTLDFGTSILEPISKSSYEKRSQFIPDRLYEIVTSTPSLPVTSRVNGVSRPGSCYGCCGSMAIVLHTSRHVHDKRARQSIQHDGTEDSHQPFSLPYRQTGTRLCCR